MKRVTFLTNVPTPYRNYHFHRIARAAASHGTVQFEVWFTGETKVTHLDTTPPFGPTDYPHRFLARASAPLRPWQQASAAVRLLQSLSAEKPEVLVIGGYFNAPLAAACLGYRRLGIRSLFYNENHKAFSSSPFLHPLRRILAGSFDGYIVPGELQERYVRTQLARNTSVPIHRMTNLVDDTRFGQGVQTLRAVRATVRQQLGVPNSARVFLAVMRLEAVKGADLLVSAAAYLPEDCVLLIAGDGCLRQTLAATEAVRTHKVRLLGRCEEATVVRLLAASDAFVLPSRNDPYPLAVIEALWSGLPLILSDAVGCHPEALEEGRNGYLCEAGSVSSLAHTLLKIASLEAWQLARMGTESAAIASERFDGRRVAEEFMSFVERF
jgi:glycosyltransferase involved in cell wall biosynthesis